MRLFSFYHHQPPVRAASFYIFVFSYCIAPVLLRSTMGFSFDYS